MRQREGTVPALIVLSVAVELAIVAWAVGRRVLR